MKSISRIDQAEKKNQGWYVRVVDPWRDRTISKWFSDRRHGSRRNALYAAAHFRDRVEKQIGKSHTHRMVTHFDGIRRVQRWTHRRKNPCWQDAFEVTWCPEPGRVKRTTVSIRKYGYRSALAKARAIRQQGLAQAFRNSGKHRRS